MTHGTRVGCWLVLAGLTAGCHTPNKYTPAKDPIRPVGLPAPAGVKAAPTNPAVNRQYSPAPSGQPTARTWSSDSGGQIRPVARELPPPAASGSVSGPTVPTSAASPRTIASTPPAASPPEFVPPPYKPDTPPTVVPAMAPPPPALNPLPPAAPAEPPSPTIQPPPSLPSIDK